MTLEHPTTGPDLTRRGVFRGIAAGGVALPVLSACGSDDGDASPGSSASASGSGPVSVAAADVPVGGGKVLADDKVVVTQPTEGDFKAFTAVCTHQGCTVGSVADGQIVCPCHGSHYSIEDGSVLSGPAPAPLAEKKVSVEGDELVVGS